MKTEDRICYGGISIWSRTVNLKPLVTSVLEEIGFLESPYRADMNKVYYGEGSELRVHFTISYPRDHRNNKQTQSESTLEILADNNEAALAAYTVFQEKMRERGAGANSIVRMITNSI